MNAINLVKSGNPLLIAQAYMLIGYYLKNGFESIGSILAQPNNFEYIFS
jgi:hypothetical protein